jgi:hypothetical protein
MEVTGAEKAANCHACSISCTPVAEIAKVGDLFETENTIEPRSHQEFPLANVGIASVSVVSSMQGCDIFFIKDRSHTLFTGS